MLPERSRARPEAMPKITAPAIMRAPWTTSIEPLERIMNSTSEAAYSALEMIVGQEPHHAVAEIVLGLRHRGGESGRRRRAQDDVWPAGIGDLEQMVVAAADDDGQRVDRTRLLSERREAPAGVERGWSASGGTHD